MSTNTDVEEVLRSYMAASPGAVIRDVTWNKHGGNPESNRAYDLGTSTRENDRLEVLRLIQERPRSMKEIAALMGKGFNAVAGRGSELKALGLVQKTGEIRDGSAVLRATK